MTTQNNRSNRLTIQLLGDINTTGEQCINRQLPIIDILQERANGMKNEELCELVQIGGPLGCFIKGKQLREPLDNFSSHLKMPSIMFFNKRFCPVDFTRFMLFFVKREMQFKSKELNLLCQLIEDIASGKARKYTFTEFIDTLKSPEEQDSTIYRLKRNALYLTLHYAKDFSTHIEQKRCKHSICHKLFAAQCINSCPAEINIPGYVALMSKGEYEQAYRLMRQNNPFSFLCGKICARPCETRCRRGEIEQTVGVRALKHYAGGVALNTEFTEERSPANGKSIGIIGSGPAGLSAAYYLAKSGYGVDVYEKHAVEGGMLALGIPAYRLSQASIDKEVDLIKNLGVKIHTNTEVGADIAFSELQSRHDSILLATGCHLPNLFSNHIDNLESAIHFLREVKCDNRQRVGKNVVVIGGGDVAMDAARTAIRLGADSVKVVSLESFVQMPANSEEREEAQAEGVEFINSYGTDTILEEGNTAYGIKLKRCISLYDIENNFAPLYNNNSPIQLNCDHIILAIGQRSDISYLNGAVAVDERQRIITTNSNETSIAGLFVAGDLSSPGSAIKAIAEGRSAAKKIDTYLNGDGLFKEQQITIPKSKLHYSIWDIEMQKEEVKLYSKTDKSPFTENRTPLSELMIRKEALRCMRCDRNSRC